jgi:signal transduction histidine kinase
MKGRNMKKCCVLLLCLALLWGAAFPIAVSANDPVTVRVGVYENSPKIFTDDRGNASGFWPDIIEYIASEEGWEVEYIHGTWIQCLNRLEKNEIDIMPDVSYTEARSKLYAFSNETVLASWSRVYAKEEADIQSILDLEGKDIAVLKGSANVEGPEGIKELVKKFDLDCTFTELDSYTKVFEMVESGEADAGVTNKDFGNMHEKDFDVERTPIIFRPSHIQFAFPKESSLTPYLIERIDYHMKDLKANVDSIYYQSLVKWLGVKPAEKPVIPGWIIWTLIGIGGLAFLLAGGSFILRSQVRAKTQQLQAEITERKQAEDELSKYRDHLEELVKERTSELEEMSRHKSQFLANMSHELRTPLNSIIGYTKLMAEGLAGGINEKQEKFLHIVYRNSKHLLELINGLLDISLIEAGKTVLSYETFPISDLLSEVIPAVEQLAREKGLVLTYSVAPGIDSLDADKVKIRQVLINILGNAIKFTSEGSVKLNVTAKDSELIFFVADTGMGIKKDDLGAIFDSFKQVGPAQIAGYEGTGLGLAISKHYIEMQGGRIWAESEPGKGSTFTFTLPRKKVSNT